MGFDFFSERLGSKRKVLKITFLLLPKHLFFLGPGCKVGKMTILTFSEKLKKKITKMFAMGFFLVNG